MPTLAALLAAGIVNRKLQAQLHQFVTVVRFEWLAAAIVLFLIIALVQKYRGEYGIRLWAPFLAVGTSVLLLGVWMFASMFLTMKNRESRPRPRPAPVVQMQSETGRGR